MRDHANSSIPGPQVTVTCCWHHDQPIYLHLTCILCLNHNLVLAGANTRPSSTTRAPSSHEIVRRTAV